MLTTIHDQWHAGGIRMEYNPGVGIKVAFITPSTTTPANVTAYAQAAGAAAKRYAGGGIIWEIYNEPDLLFGEDINVGLCAFDTRLS